MKCRYCGHEIPDGVLYCENCGKEVRIVPDYNPLDDILAQEIVGSINGEPTGLDLSDTERLRRTASQRRTTGRTMRGTGTMTEDREARRRQAQRRKAQLRKKRRILLAVMFLILAALIGGIVLIYKNSYNGIVSAGNKALERQEYSEASSAFQRAIGKNKERPEAYTGLSRVYLAQNDPDAAESVFLDAIEEQAGNSDLYGACIDFYIDTKQQMEIPGLLDEATDQVREALSEYIIDVPEFSLDAKETYEEVQQLTLTAGKGLTIYYTVDGSDPDTGSTKYTEPIQLDEGETTVTAIAVNKNGIPSMPEAKEYVIELPIEDAPAVSPSTGQYEAATSIEVKVPDGYEAYYTTDGSDPTTASAKYTGPVNMPEGETLFKAVLVSGDGRLSGITTRNYVLELPSDSSEE
ncbi:chitobiase/beta-hexosaminidase C-terminal domain-containing protein [Massilistercora timonensis]|uniref:chitobiase/beta-hexosaminidase C-terminal domain-containing protein n=1 Tax=Massilistercora timonensis TaxID=2086584 RepID=UPI00320B05ED